MTPQLRLGRVEETSRIECVVAPEIKRISVDAVGAGLGNRVHHRAAEFSILGIKAVGDQPEFLHGIKIGDQPGAQVAPLAHVAAVHQKRIGGLPLAIYGKVASVRRVSPRNRPVLLNRAGSHRHHSCLQAEEVQVAAAIQWERQHFLRFDHVAQLRVFGLDLHGIGRDFDHFIDTPNLQRDVDAQLVVHFQVDIRRVVLFESGCCHRHLVSSGRQSQDAVGTVCS